MNDLVHWIMARACDDFGDVGDKIFSGACFSHAWNEVTGLKAGLDGRAVAAILYGRSDVTQLSGGSHYQMVVQNDDGKKGNVNGG